ncbi:MAG: MBL fold metallo-hydrolase [Candidatus Bathyarchaeota archaeon]|nr:MAG: MBL fold metallo-hydrolase [Candidatus Bathyarchaeota archaeon]
MSPVQDLRITTLADNFAPVGGLGQGGLSLLLELVDARGARRKMVFDTSDHKEALMHNIKDLKVDLSDIDCVILSHGHHDHIAVTAEVVKAAGGVKVYAHPHTLLPRIYVEKTGKRRHIGAPKGEGLKEIERSGGEVILATKPVEVVPGVWTSGQIERKTTFENVLPLSEGERLIVVINGEETDDRILDDQALWMDVGGVGPCVVTGCAHAGPVNTLLHVQKIGRFKEIHGLVGGTHLIGRSEEYLKQTITELRKFRLALISPCHCTGFKAMTRLWQAFPDAFILNFVGRAIEAAKETKVRVI